jgi:DNA-binding CsgD family transcriptional regulator/tetratricopeptide (TPR) repeat protein
MELLERDKHLSELDTWLGFAAQDGGSIALVAGEAGIGKTALLREFSGRRPEMRVLWGTCDALAAPRPLAPLHDIARQTRGVLLAALASGANRDAIFSAALDEVDREAGTLVVLEDMHWADAATLDLLKFLGRRIHLTRALLVATYRDDETGARHPLRVALGDLPSASTRALLLPPLSDGAVARLAGECGRPATDLHAMTGGNPFLVTAMLGADAGTVPVTVRDAMLARLVRLSPAARELVEFVSTIPGRAEPWLLHCAGPMQETTVEECVGIGLLRGDDGTLAFRHELARRSLEASLSPARRRSLHDRALVILASRQDVATALLAYHAQAAHNTEAVLRFAPLAALDAAARGAHREAASYYELALRYASDLSAPERARLHEHLSHEYTLTGEYRRAIEARRCALAIWQTSRNRTREAETLRYLSRLSRSAGDLAAAREYGAAAIERLEALPPRVEHSMAYSNRAELDLESGDSGSALDWSSRAVALAESLGCHATLSHALASRGSSRLLVGDDSGWADLERGFELARRGALREELAHAYTGLAAMTVARRRYADARRYVSDGLAYCDEQGFDSLRMDLIACRARLGFDRGEWNRTNDDVVAVLRNPDTSPSARIAALEILGHLRIRRGESEYAVPLEEARFLGGPTLGPRRIAALAAIRAEGAWVIGDRAGVLREAEPAYELLRAYHDPWLKGQLAVLLWKVGALPEVPVDIEEPYALEINGDWCGAARIWSAVDCPYEHAGLLACNGAEREQRVALTALDQMGAAPAALALRRRMRALAVRGVPRGSRPSTVRHPLGLTRRQAEILALLSEGLRNSAIAKRLFVSTKTVDHHVSAILAKLAVPTRMLAVARAYGQPVPRV